MLVVEVLSRSTHEIDRGRKWLASQDEPRIEIYRRSDEGWSYIIVTGLEAAITLEPGSTTIPLAGIYEQSSVASS